MKEVKATYNEKDDGFVPVAEGTYPAHVSKFESNEYSAKQKGASSPNNQDASRMV